MSPAVLAPAARRELIAIVRWIATDHPAAAKAFRDAVNRAAERIGRHPLIGVQRPELAPGLYRFVALSGFPYLIVYQPHPDPPVILRIVHSARDLPRILRDLG